MVTYVCMRTRHTRHTRTHARMYARTYALSQLQNGTVLLLASDIVVDRHGLYFPSACVACPRACTDYLILQGGRDSMMYCM